MCLKAASGLDFFIVVIVAAELLNQLRCSLWPSYAVIPQVECSIEGSFVGVAESAIS